MKQNLFVFILLGLMVLGCKSREISHATYESNTLRIQYLTHKTIVHISYLDTKKFGKVPCNGMIVVDKGEAIVFDTPTNDDASAELIDWLEKKSGYKVKAVVTTHFHVDCLGGLTAFHQRNIPSYALNRTLTLAESDSVTLPQNGFDSFLELKVGDKIVNSEFLGEGHTQDNIICHVPSENVMFGGCLIKSEGAGKGNLNDANINEWSNTVRKVKTKYPDVYIVIPGHGKHGGSNLFDYTINLFD